MNLPEKIQTESNPWQYLSYMIDVLGWGFHPDDYIGDNVKDDGTPVFNKEQVVVLEGLSNESFHFCEQNGMNESTPKTPHTFSTVRFLCFPKK